MRPLAPLLVLVLLAPAVATAETIETTDPVTVPAMAVARLEDGSLVGSASTVHVSVARNGSGLVFMDTRPLAQVDMQGSARLAVRVASAVTGYAEDEHDFFFVVRSPSAIVGGPSAGSVLTLATIVAIENAHLEPGEQPWEVDPAVAVTGTINPDGTIGPVGGLPQKADAARSIGARTFLVPTGQANYTFQEDGQVRIVHMPTYCRGELGITCREVGRITDLVEIATGHRLVVGTDEVPSTAEYAAVLGPLARDMVNAVEARWDRAWAEANATTTTQDQRDVVTTVLSQARPQLNSAGAALLDERYYSATSFAFQASRNVALTEGLLDYFRTGLDLAVVDARIAEAEAWLQRATTRAANGRVDGINDLLAVGAAQERVSQAEALVDEARQARNRTTEFADVRTALDRAGFAIERARTVMWWANLTRHFGPGPDLAGPVTDLAADFLDATRETVEYVSVISSVRSDAYTEAVRMLGLAERDLDRGLTAGALVEAAEAQVFATFALEIGAITDDRIEVARDDAADGIARARQAGIEPVLAVSMFEFGGDNEGSPLGIQFYRQARVVAGMAVFLTGATGEPTESAFVGRPNLLEPVGPTPTEMLRSVAAGYFIMGAFLAGTATLFVAVATHQRRPPQGPGP